MPEPTIDDYKRRLERLLNNELAVAGQARAQLALDGAKHGHFSDNSSGFRLQEDQLAKERFIVAMEVALTECRRASDRTALDPAEVFEATSQAVSQHLDALIPMMMPQNPAFVRGGLDTSLRANDAYGRLRDLQAEVFWEYNHGLYALPGELGSPVVINVANVNGSNVRSIQQSGSGSAQRGDSGK